MDDYLNVVEIEAAIARLADTNPLLCKLLELPNKSAEDRISHALRISTAPGAGRDTLVVIAGVHAREWGTSDAAVVFAKDLLAAYAQGTGLGYGSKIFAKEDIQAFLNTRDLVVFPQVNPDGRAYSQANDATVVEGWRKNRRYLSGQGRKKKYGVDINRNFETAWDFKRLFADGTAPASDVEGADNYHGPSPFSEAESKNVRDLLNDHSKTRWLVDVHGPAVCILYNWGIDETQSDTEEKNFRNSDWDHRRGKKTDAYAEYKKSEDSQLAKALAVRMSDAMSQVRRNRWPARPSFDSLYPVSGSLADYAYARQWAVPPLPKIHSFVIEHGGSFHPPWPIMAGVIDEICAALLELCVAVT